MSLVNRKNFQMQKLLSLNAVTRHWQAASLTSGSYSISISQGSVATCLPLRLRVLEHSSICCCSNPNEGTLLLCISVSAVLVDVLMHAIDLHKTASR